MTHSMSWPQCSIASLTPKHRQPSCTRLVQKGSERCHSRVSSEVPHRDRDGDAIWEADQLSNYALARIWRERRC